MHCHDYQAEPMRSCCATTIGEEHAPGCNRAQERRMIAAADERVRQGQDRHRALSTGDWQPAPRVVHDITMWDAPDDAAATIPLSAEPDATGYAGDDDEKTARQRYVEHIMTANPFFDMIPWVEDDAADLLAARAAPAETDPRIPWDQARLELGLDDFFAPDPELEQFVSRVRTAAWLVLLVPVLAGGAFVAGAHFAGRLERAAAPAAAWGQALTVVAVVAGLAAIASSLIGADERQ